MKKTLASALLLTSLSAPALSSNARAGTVGFHPFPQEASWNSLLGAVMQLSKDYQIGNEWGKKPVTTAQLSSATPEFVRAATATASYGGGTAFYLGKFNGRHLMGTNHHVQPSMNCRGAARFQILAKNYSCVQVLGHWTAIDFALFTIEVPAADEAKLATIGKNFNFDRPLVSGQTLLTVGHGVADNPGRRLVANQDGDCKVFSEEFRFMADPDEYNHGTYQAWSFANGCDVSHGDSGSAMVDRVTGEPVGIIWTGRIPKNPEAQDSAKIDEWLRTQSPEIWKQLSYAVPASKIREILREVVAKEGSLDLDVANTIRELVH